MDGFETRYMSRPQHRPGTLYDYQICESEEHLSQIIDEINFRRYQIISVTQDPAGRYTVIFLR